MANRAYEVVVKFKDQASAKIGGVKGRMADFIKQNPAMAAAAAAAAIAVVAAFVKIGNAIKDAVQEAANFGDDLDKMSARTNTSAERLAEWTFLMERAGGTSGSLEASVRRLTKSMFDKSVGLSTAVRAWEDMGVATTDAEGKMRSVDAVLLDIADKLHTMDDRTKALGMSQDLLGRGAAQMVALLSQGRPELERQLGIFEAINGEMGEGYTKGAAALIDAQTDLKWSIAGLRADLTEPLMPVLAEVIDDVAVSVGNLGKWASTHKDDIKETAAAIGEISLSLVKASSAIATSKIPKLALDFFTLGSASEWQRTRMKEQNEELRLQIPLLSELSGAWDTYLTTLGPYTEEAEKAKQETTDLNGELGQLGMVAEGLGVSLSETKFDVGSMMFVDVPKTAEKLAADIEAAYLAAEARLAQGPPVPGRDTGVSGTEGDWLQDFTDASGVITDLDLNTKDWRDTLGETEQAASSLVDRLGSVGSTALSSLLTAEKGAIMLGRAITNVVISALSEMIVKMLFIKTIGAALGSIFGFTGTPAAGAPGGPAGPPSPGGGLPLEFGGPAFAMPRGGFSMAQSQQGYVSPFSLTGGSGSGGSKSVSVSMVVGRPVGYLDFLDLGEAAVTAAQHVSEADL